MFFLIPEGGSTYANLNSEVVKCEDKERWDGERGGTGSLTSWQEILGTVLVRAATEMKGEGRVHEGD